MAELAGLTTGQLRDAILLKGAVQIPRRWDVPKRCTPEELLTAARDTARHAVGGFLRNEQGRPCYTAAGGISMQTLAEAPEVKALWRSWTRTRAVYEAHTGPMHLAPGLVGMGDDKERGFGWKVPYHA